MTAKIIGLFYPNLARPRAALDVTPPSLARACHAEAFFVPHSAMASWVRGAAKAIMIDGCFLKCHGRILSNLIPKEKLVQFDAHLLHKKFGDVFLMDDVPEVDRHAVAREVADRIIATLQPSEHRKTISS